MGDRRAEQKTFSEVATPYAADHQAYQVRLPGFIKDEELGFGDVIKRATYSLGIRPCTGCERRAAALNRWVVFTR
jgi:hypothetical protein